MEIFNIIDAIEIGNNYTQDGLDYFMDCVVDVNKVKTRCEQISRRGEFITWMYIEDIESLEVNEVVNGNVPTDKLFK